MIRLAIGCVTEPNPKYLNQTIMLLQTLREFGGSMSQCDFYVCSTGHIPKPYMEELIRYHPNIIQVPRFPDHPPSNKLRFLEMIVSKERYSHVMLLDCDTVICGDFSQYIKRTVTVSAKLADRAGVPEDLFKSVFGKLGKVFPGMTCVSDIDSVPMPPYYNAGVMIFERRTLEALLPQWINFNTQIIEKNLLESRQFFTDQVSFAVATSNIRIQLLPPRMNYPTHFAPAMYPESYKNTSPLIIHHHNRLDNHGRLLSLPFPGVDIKVCEINHYIAKSWRQNFNQTRFWNTRYQLHPKLGSGHGSRGKSAEYKQQLIAGALVENDIRTMLDIGCGDLKSVQNLVLPDYVGVDLSSVVIEIAQKTQLKAVSQKFFCGNFMELSLISADLVICFDVLLHLDSYHKYYWAVNKLVDLTDKVGIVSGYASSSDEFGIVFFYESLEKTLKDAGATNIQKIGEYRNTSVYSYGPLVDNSWELG